MTALNGKVALITGTSAGLGAATAKVFAERGASVFGIARGMRAAVADCVAAFGRLDVLVNVAGFHQMRHTPTMTDAEWERDLVVNLHGPFYLCRAALPHLLEAGGNIVNVSSIAGVEGEVYSAGYCAAKHGLIGTDPRPRRRVHEGQAARERGVPRWHATAQATEFRHPTTRTVI
jgi:meso-butanediol dehydrogenase / (S,S)-butanediol dehydrogenase / diacetyl reductase